MNLKRATKKDVKIIVDIASRCFLLNPKEIQSIITNDPRSAISDFFISSEGKEPTGCLKINPLETHIRNTKLKCGGIGAVAVLPEFRRRGIADTLVNTSLQTMYNEKYPVSILYPFQHRFYRKFGWETCGVILRYKVNPQNIISPNNVNNIRKWRLGDKKAIKKLYSQKALESSCFITRNDKFWEKNIFPKWKDVSIFEDKGLEGYMVYELSREKNNNVKLFIKEFIALNHNAYSGLLTFLVSLGEQVHTIEYLTSDDEPFLDFLKEPKENEFERVFFEYKSLCTYSPGFMLRVVNLREALKRIGTLRTDNFKITFQIDDPILKDNSIPISIISNDGKINLSDEYFESNVLKTNINIFSQIFSGFISTSKLKWFGKAECSESTASLCDVLFKTSSPFIQQADTF
jgi:predicted acetyltransferase